MTEQKQYTGYELGKQFYDARIAEAQRLVDAAQTPYFKIVAIEKLEEYMLKLSQLTRREQIFGKKV